MKSKSAIAIENEIADEGRRLNDLEQSRHSPYRSLMVRPVKIDTYRENIIYMRSDCPVCKSEGFSALTRIVVYYGERSIIATLNVVSDLVGHGEAGLSNEALRRLQVQEGCLIQVGHLKPEKPSQVCPIKNVRPCARKYGFRSYRGRHCRRALFQRQLGGFHHSLFR